MTVIQQNPQIPNTTGSDSPNRPPMDPNPPSAYQDGETFAPWRWGHPPGFVVDRTNASAGVERTVTAGSTILQSIVPVVAGGPQRVEGMTDIMECPTWSNHLWLTFIFCRGEISATTEIYLNDVKLGTTAANALGVQSYQLNLGTPDQTVPTWFTPFADYEEAMPGFVVLYVRIYLPYREEETSQYSAHIITNGQKFYDWRTSTWAESSNPAVVAAHIETFHEWKKNPWSMVHTDNWTEIADWYDEVMSDGTKRFEFIGQLSRRDSDEAQSEVLGSALSRMVSYDGQWLIVAPKPPKSISGTWTASGSTTLTGTGGAATTEVRKGDGLLLASTVYTVVSDPTDNNVIEVAEEATMTGATLLLVSSLILSTSNSIGVPEGGRLDPAEIQNVLRVKYVDAVTGKADHFPAVLSGYAPTVGEEQIGELSYAGVSSKSHAGRIGYLKLKLDKFAPFWWKGVWDSTCATLLPGDICRGSFGDGTLNQLVKVVFRFNNRDGSVSYELVEYDPAATSDDVNAEDTIPSTTPPDEPTLPTGFEELIDEVGPWAEDTQIGDPDDLPTAGWTPLNGNITQTYDGVNEWTSIARLTSATNYLSYTFTPESTELRFGFKIAVALSDDLSNLDQQLQIKYLADGVIRRNVVCNPKSTAFDVFMFAFDVDTAASTHELRIQVSGTDYTDVIRVKALRMVRLARFQTIGTTKTLIPGSSVYAVRLRYAWVEDGDAADTTSRYILAGNRVDGGIVLLKSVEVGTNVLEYALGYNVVSVVIPDGSVTPMEGVTTVSPLNGQLYMLLESLTGLRYEMGAPTQAFVDEIVPGQPVSIDQKFIEMGDWDNASGCGDPGLLDGTWVEIGTTLTNTPGSPDLTKVVSASGAGAKALTLDGINPGYAPDTAVITFYAKGPAASPNNEWRFYLLDDNTGSPFNDVIALSLGNLLRRHTLIVDSSTLSSPYEFELYFGRYDPTGTDADEWWLGGVRFVWPAFTSSLGLAERWTWTEAADADETVARYELARVFPNGDVQVLATAPVGSTFLEAVTFNGGSLPAGGSWNEYNRSRVVFRVVSKTGVISEVDPDTQSTGTREYGDKTTSLKDFSTTPATDGQIPVFDDVTEKYVPTSQGTGGGIDATTLESMRADEFRQSKPYPYTGTVYYALIGTYGGAATKLHVETVGGYIYYQGTCKTECMFAFGVSGGAYFAYAWSLWGNDDVNRSNVVVYDNGDNTWSVYLKSNVWGNGFARATVYENATQGQGGQITGIVMNGRITELDTNANWTSSTPSGTLVFDSGVPGTYKPRFRSFTNGDFLIRSNLEMYDSGGTQKTALHTETNQLNVGDDFGTVILTPTNQVVAPGINNVSMKALNNGSPSAAWLQWFKLDNSNVFGFGEPTNTYYNVYYGSKHDFRGSGGIIVASGAEVGSYSGVGGFYPNLAKYIAGTTSVELGDTGANATIVGAGGHATYNGSNLLQATDAGATGLSLLAATSAAAARTTLGLGALATMSSITTSYVSDISAFGASLIDDADASAARTTLGLGSLATLSTVTTAYITNDAVTYAKIQNVSAGYLLGRAYGGSAGDCTELATTDITKIGTGGYSGITDASVDVQGYGFVGHYHLTFTNGWLTGRVKDVTG